MRYTAIVRASYATLLLLASGTVVRLVSGGSEDRVTTVAGRVLGFRHLAQALIVDCAGTRSRLLVGVVIDAVHALSMLGLALSSKGYRRPAALDAVLATGWTLNGLREARNAR